MPVIEMPDGQLVEVSENPSPAEVALLDRVSRAQPGVVSRAATSTKDAAKSLVAGFGKTASLAPTALSYLSPPAGSAGYLRELGEGAYDYWDQFGKGGNNRYVNAGLEGVGAAAVGGPTRLAAMVLAGGGSGLGGEAASQLSGGDKLATVVGSLLGGLGGSALQMARTNRPFLVKEATEGVSENQLRDAQALMREAADKSGITLNLSQAMRSPSNIDDIVNDLANSRYGKVTTTQLRTQPKEVSLAAEVGMANLPGRAQMPQTIANSAQEGATSYIKGLQEAAGKAWAKQAPQGEVFLPQAMASLDQSLAAMATKYPNTAGADLMNEVRAALKQPGSQAPPTQMLGKGVVTSTIPVAKTQTPKYLEDALQVKGAIEDVLATYGARKLNTPSLDATTQRRAQEIRELYKLMIDTEAPKLKAANDAYSAVMRNAVEPAKKSVVGRVAGLGGASADREAVQGRVFGILDAGTVPGAKRSEILTLEKALRKADPTVFQDTVKTWLSKKVSEAAKQEGGRTGERVAHDLEKTLLGNDVKAQGFKDMMVGLARSQGLPDNSLYPGMHTLMQHISAAARRPGSVSQFPARDLQATASNSATATLLQSNAVTPGWAVGKQLRMALSADAYRFMDKLLTSPEGVDTLIKLSKQPVMSKAAANTLATFLATLEQSQDQSPGIMPE